MFITILVARMGVPGFVSRFSANAFGIVFITILVARMGVPGFVSRFLANALRIDCIQTLTTDRVFSELPSNCMLLASRRVENSAC